MIDDVCSYMLFALIMWVYVSNIFEFAGVLVIGWGAMFALEVLH